MVGAENGDFDLFRDSLPAVWSARGFVSCTYGPLAIGLTRGFSIITKSRGAVMPVPGECCGGEDRGVGLRNPNGGR